MVKLVHTFVTPFTFVGFPDFHLIVIGDCVYDAEHLIECFIIVRPISIDGVKYSIQTFTIAISVSDTPLVTSRRRLQNLTVAPRTVEDSLRSPAKYKYNIQTRLKYWNSPTLPISRDDNHLINSKSLHFITSMLGMVDRI